MNRSVECMSNKLFVRCKIRATWLRKLDRFQVRHTDLG